MLDDLNAQVGAIISKMEAAQKTKSVREMLLEQNQPKRIDADHHNFLCFCCPGQQSDSAGRQSQWQLVSAAKIFSKLAQIAKPGDRVVVTFGAGHCYWLRHFVRNTPGFVLVEVGDYLR